MLRIDKLKLTESESGPIAAQVSRHTVCGFDLYISKYSLNFRDSLWSYETPGYTGVYLLSEKQNVPPDILEIGPIHRDMGPRHSAPSCSMTSRY